MTNTSSNDKFAHQPFLTMKEVCALTGYSRTHIYRREAAGTFPRRVKLGPNSIRFLKAQIWAWVESRPYADPSSEDDDDGEGSP